MGKSTLLNALVGEKLSIITNKPQTTRHRILAILNEAEYQIVFSDTPGIVREPAHKMHAAMNTSAYSALEDADILIYMTDVLEEQYIDFKLAKRIKAEDVPTFLVINKIDLSDEVTLKILLDSWTKELNFDHICAISAKEKAGIDGLLKLIISHLKKGPAYYPKDQFSDKSERFFVSEIIREQILIQFHQEIPYSCEVVVHHFKEQMSKNGSIVNIKADIILNRQSQKSILIGKNGKAIKTLGTEARKAIELFLGQRVFLELYVRVKEKWRDDERMLKSYGYIS